MPDTADKTWGTGLGTTVSGGPISIEGGNTADVKITLDSESITISNFPDLIKESYDTILLQYTGSTLTSVLYKLSGDTVATLTLNYAGATFTGVTKT